MKRTLCYAMCVGVLRAAVPRAQTPAPPPKVIRIFEENVKVGKAAAHEKVETNWTKAFASAKWPGQSLAMKTIAGPPQAWFIEPHESMASIEKLSNDTEKMTALTAQTDLLSAQDGELLTGVRTIIATYREDLSYLPANGLPVPKLRYFDVEIFQVRPGHNAEFIESRQLMKAAHEKAKMPDGTVYYAVAAGAPNGTFFRFRGLQSLADEDRYESAHSAKSYQDAVGASTKRIDELTSSSVVNTQHLIYQFDPKMSYMPKEFTSVDPDFWTPKPKPAVSNATPATDKKPKASGK
jgi:hypothetical protein